MKTVNEIKELILSGKVNDHVGTLMCKNTIFHAYPYWELFDLALEHGYNVNARDRYGNTIFHHKSFVPEEILEKAVANGFDINSVNSDLYETIFHDANHSPFNCFKKAIDLGFNPNIKSKTGALIFSHRPNSVELIEYAIIYGKMDPNLKSNNGYTLLHDYRNLPALKTALRYGFNINAKNKNGKTIFHYNNDSKYIIYGIMNGFKIFEHLDILDRPQHADIKKLIFPFD